MTPIRLLSLAPILFRAVLGTVGVPPSEQGPNTVAFPAVEPRVHSRINAPWTQECGLTFKIREDLATDAHHDSNSSPRKNTSPLQSYPARNGSIWVMKGIPVDYRDCLGSEGLAPPKMLSVPTDVCLYGGFNNVTILLRDAAVCPDGSIPWMAMYQDRNCHSFPYLVNPDGMVPGSWCMWGSSFWDETRIIRQFSVIFRCVTVVDGDMPKKLMNAELDEPVLEDPPKDACCMAAPGLSPKIEGSGRMRMNDLIEKGRFSFDMHTLAWYLVMGVLVFNALGILLVITLVLWNWYGSWAGRIKI